jgi:hypothetical protein
LLINTHLVARINKSFITNSRGKRGKGRTETVYKPNERLLEATVWIQVFVIVVRNNKAKEKSKDVYHAFMSASLGKPDATEENETSASYIG